MSGDGLELGISDGHLDSGALPLRLSQPYRHRVAQQVQAGADLVPVGQVVPKGHAVADGLGRRTVSRWTNRIVPPPPGVVVELGALLAHHFLQHGSVGVCQLTDGLNAVPVQDALRCPPHKEQVRDGQGPDDGLPVGGGDDGGGVRFFVVTAQLGEHFIIGDPPRRWSDPALSG